MVPATQSEPERRDQDQGIEVEDASALRRSARGSRSARGARGEGGVERSGAIAGSGASTARGMLTSCFTEETYAIPGMSRRNTKVRAQRTCRAEADVLRKRKLKAKATKSRSVVLAARRARREEYPSRAFIPDLLCFSPRR
jgi:hypothetical protein